MIIEYGNKLGKDTKPDQKKLELLEGENKHTTIVTNNKNKQEKNIETVDKNEKNLKSNSLYSINSIETENNTIVIKFNKEISKQDIAASSLKNKNGFDNIVDINGTYNPNKVEDLSIDGIEDITLNQKNNLTRIKISNKTNPKINYSLAKKELIITINTPSSSTTSKISTNNSTTSTKSPSRTINKTVVIDAGHGAEDVGAVGPNKEYEKVINLNVARYLYAILKQRGYKVYITRNDDHFIPVRERTVLANEKNADIFISVHTNSVPKEKAHDVMGIETFFLSPARSERAKRVAAVENKSDVSDMNSSTKDAFLETLNRPRITASHKLAIDVQAGLLQSAKTKFSDINDSGVREGPFWVLVGAQMPSILVEVGYVSHPKESKRLYSKDYQQLLANGIANGVDSYFAKNP